MRGELWSAAKLRGSVKNMVMELHLLDDGLVRIELKRAFSDGTIAVDMDPLSLLCRLAAAVPPPKMHVLKYAGVLAAAHKWRALVVPPLPVEDTEDDPGKSPEGDMTDSARAHAHAHAHAEDAERKRPATHRSQYRPWAQLMQRTFKIEVDKCERCGSRMKLRALVIAVASKRRCSSRERCSARRIRRATRAQVCPRLQRRPTEQGQSLPRTGKITPPPLQ